jgi:hypothetical protein
MLSNVAGLDFFVEVAVPEIIRCLPSCAMLQHEAFHFGVKIFDGFFIGAPFIERDDELFC